jgi:4,5-DOPA dioxygenase extradiol
MNRQDFLHTLFGVLLFSKNMDLTDFQKVTDKLSKSNKLPALFIGHGSPMNAIQENAFTKRMNQLGKEILSEYQPKAILVVSAHWLTRGSYVCNVPEPEIIYDFGGFPEELYKVQYPAKGSPELAKEVIKLSSHIKETDQWGLDHGAWTILKHIFPKAQIPVFQLSIDFYQPLRYHLELANQLKKIREKGVLVVGSGNVVHNIRMSVPYLMSNNPKPLDWAIEFDEWVKGNLITKNYEALLQYDKMGNAAKLSVPSTDHYIPMLYTVGITDSDENIQQVFEEVSYGGMSMRAFRIG